MTESNRHPRNTSMAFVKQATTWLAAGGVAATGLFAGLAVASNSGHANVSRPISTTNATTTTTPTVPSTSAASDDDEQFRAPTTAPTTTPTTAAPSTGGAAVVSGGS